MSTRIEITGRTALVTGGANGIGLSLTRLLLREGAARVLVVGRDPGRLERLEAESPQVTPLRADLSDPADVDRLIGEVARFAPELSLLINNAGTQQLTDFTSADAPSAIPAMRSEIEVNLTAVVALSAGLLPLLARQPSAALVNVTSGLALAPKKSSPVYCATKAGVRAFTQALRYQCEDAAPHVRIVEALPPAVDTDMTRGRGRGKISPDACAAEILAGLKAGRPEIYVAAAKLLRVVDRLSPGLARRLMRDV
jgi:uncharacterized oxidoreductase